MLTTVFEGDTYDVRFTHATQDRIDEFCLEYSWAKLPRAMAKRYRRSYPKAATRCQVRRLTEDGPVVVGEGVAFCMKLEQYSRGEGRRHSLERAIQNSFPRGPRNLQAAAKRKTFRLALLHAWVKQHVDIKGATIRPGPETACFFMGSLSEEALRELRALVLPYGLAQQAWGHQGTLSEVEMRACATYPLMKNLAMARKLVSGAALDVSDCRRDGDQYVLESFESGKDYCDAKSEHWIWSIGQNMKTGAILAATDGRFYQNPDFHCLFLR